MADVKAAVVITLDFPITTGKGEVTTVSLRRGKARDMLGTFKPAARGAEETYTGTLQSAGDERPLDKGVLMWTVRGPAATELQPGLLQGAFTVDAAAAANQVAPLIAEKTPIVLQAAKKEMQQPANAETAKPTTVIISIVLKLKSSPA